MKKKTVIHYMNAHPGIGKTHSAVLKMANIAGIEDRPSIIYTSPTIRLLGEVYEDLTSRIPETEIKNIIRLVSSRGRESVVTKIKEVLENPKNFNNKIIMITHEAFIRLPLLKEFKHYEVLFDEARKVVMEGENIPITSKFDFNVLKTTSKKSEIVPGYYTVDEQKFKAALAKLRTEGTRRRFSSLFALYDKIRNPRIEVFLDIKKGLRNRGGSLNFYEIVLPSKLFTNFKSVLLMASHFDESQMYWILKTDPTIKMVNVSDRLTATKEGRKRYEKIKERYGRVRIFPLTLNPTPLSKTLIYNNVFIKQSSAKDISTLNVTASELRKAMEFPEETSTEIIEAIEAYDGDIVYDPLTHLLKVSKKFCEKIKAKYPKYDKKPLLLINKHMENFIDKSRTKEYWEQLPFTSHGLNSYQDRNILVFLAAVLLNNSLKAFLKARIPKYNPDLDHVADVCNQSVCRTCVRNPKSEADVFVIVPDLKIAELLQSKLMGMSKINNYITEAYKPQGLITLTSLRNVRSSLKKKDTEEKKHRKEIESKVMKEVRASSEYKKYRSCANTESQAKRNGTPYEKHTKRKLKAKKLCDELKLRLLKTYDV